MGLAAVRGGDAAHYQTSKQQQQHNQQEKEEKQRQWQWQLEDAL